MWHGTPAEKAAEAFKADRAQPSLTAGTGSRAASRCATSSSASARGGRSSRTRRLALPRRAARVAGGRAGRPYPASPTPAPTVIICHLLGLAPVPWEWERFVLGHGSISRMEALEVGDGHCFSLTRLSDVEHLSEHQRTR